MALILSVGVGACKKKEEPIKISLDSAQTTVEENGNNGRHLKIAVGGMITPKAGVAYYREFLHYLAGKIGIPVDYVDRESYAEINEMLRTRQLDAAFVCSGPYVDGHKQFGLELLVAPQAYGATVYYSYIIVAKDNTTRSFSELRGSRFAFTDPLSNTGKLVPTFMLAKMGETPESFFKGVIFTKSHDKSIQAVAEGGVDAAAVDSLIWEYLDKTAPEFTAKTRILQKSAPYGIPPVAVPADLDSAVKEKLRQAFLNAHADPNGQAILQKMMIDKFVVIGDEAYDSVREMQAWDAGERTPGQK